MTITAKPQLSTTELVLAWLLGIYLGVIAAAAGTLVLLSLGIETAWRTFAAQMFTPIGATAAILFAATAPFAIIGGLLAAAAGRKTAA